jgi:hypothetical protein
VCTYKGMSRYYCGAKNSPPRKHQLAPESKCRGQVRAYGVKMASVVPPSNTEKIDRATYTTDTPGSSQRTLAMKGRCGMRSPTGRMENCKSHHRRYGVHPIVKGVNDLASMRFYAVSDQEFTSSDWYPSQPIVTIDHPYSQRVYTNEGLQKGKEVLLVSVYKNDLGRNHEVNVQAKPQKRGGVGFALGYFDGSKSSGRGLRQARGGKSDTVVFHIVRIHVNPPYRKGGAQSHAVVGSLIIEKLVKHALGRVRQLQNTSMIPSGTRTVEFRPDPNAPCYMLGPPYKGAGGHHWTKSASESMTEMYAAAGFEKEAALGKKYTMVRSIDMMEASRE